MQTKLFIKIKKLYLIAIIILTSNVLCAMCADSMERHAPNPLKRVFIKYALTGDKTSLNTIMSYYSPLARQYVAHFRARLPSFYATEDLDIIALYGLLDAIETYDNRSDFIKLAANRISLALLEALKDKSWIEALINSRHGLIDRARAQLRSHGSPHPDLDQLFKDMIHKVNRFNALDDPKALSATFGEFDLNAYSHVFQMRGTGRQLFIQIVKETLSRDERLVLVMYYYEGLFFEEIAAIFAKNLEMGATPLGKIEEYVKFLLKSAIGKLTRIHQLRLEQLTAQN